MKAGASWRGGGGGGGVAAKNTFKIGGGPSVVLSSGRSTPQTLNSSFISAFITVHVLSSSATFSCLWVFFFLIPSSKEDPSIKTPGSRFEKRLSLLLVQINVFKSRYCIYDLGSSWLQ